jgi:hypothetical protein
MTSSTINELHSGSPSPIADQGDDIDVANDDQGQNWLTIRRRCELCKQRKVRPSITPQVLSLHAFIPSLNIYTSKIMAFPRSFNTSPWPKLFFRLRWLKTRASSASDRMQPSQRHHLLSDHYHLTLHIFPHFTSFIYHLTLVGEMRSRPTFLWLVQPQWRHLRI